MIREIGLGLWGVLTNQKLKRLLNSIPGLLVLALVFWHVATIPTALKLSVAIASALAFFGIVSLTLTAVAMQGAQKVIFDACLGLALYEVVSLVLYVVSPEVAIY